MLINAPTLAVNLSSSRPWKRRKCIRKIEDGHDPDLEGYYEEDCFPKDRSHDWVIKIVFSVHLELLSLL
jgi:hypothetical protein